MTCGGVAVIMLRGKSYSSTVLTAYGRAHYHTGDVAASDLGVGILPDIVSESARCWQVIITLVVPFLQLLTAHVVVWFDGMTHIINYER